MHYKTSTNYLVSPIPMKPGYFVEIFEPISRLLMTTNGFMINPVLRNTFFPMKKLNFLGAKSTNLLHSTLVQHFLTFRSKRNVLTASVPFYSVGPTSRLLNFDAGTKYQRFARPGRRFNSSGNLFSDAYLDDLWVLALYFVAAGHRLISTSLCAYPFAILCLCVCKCVTVYFLNTIGHCFMNLDEKLLNVELIASQ